jgi:type VI protein secretion system component VasK
MQTLEQMLGIGTNPAPAGGQTTKVASATSDIDTLVSAALNAGVSEKTAAQAGGGDVQTDLTKMAAQLLATDGESEKRASYEHGRLMGAGFIDELSAHAKAAAELNQQTDGQKVAEEQMLVEKLAAEHPADFERIVQQGYNDATAHLQKVAQAHAQQGYQDTLDAAHKTAMAHFGAGFDAFVGAVKEAQAQAPQGR